MSTRPSEDRGAPADEPTTVSIESPTGVTIVADVYSPYDSGDGDGSGIGSETGTARSPVVLAHGGGQTRHSWGGTARVLAARGRPVASIDLRGHGDSSWAPDGDYHMSAYRDDALAVCRWMTTRYRHPLAWVGASLGGMTGLHAISAEPELFSALVLVDITPRPAAAGVSRILAFMAENAEHGFASLDEAADAIAAYQPHRPRPTDLSGLAKNLRLGDDGRWRWHWDPRFLDMRSGEGSEHARDAHHGELETFARGLRAPTLLVRGKLSDLVTQAEVDEFLEMVPHAEYVDVADAAHMIAGDRNDVFTDAVAGFLDRH